MSLARAGQRGATRRAGKKPGRVGVGGAIGRIGGQLLGGAGGRRRRPRRRRAKGISGSELRGFNRVSRLLGKFGMVPRKLRGARTPMRSKR